MKQHKRFHPFALIHFVALLIACHDLTAGAQTVPPLIVSQPQGVSVGVGGQARFAVSAEGTPPIYYQWQMGGANLPGETTSTLLVTNVQLIQAGSVSVLVSNAVGSLLSAPATLDVSALAVWRGDTNLPPNLGCVKAISGGWDFSLALRTEGTVVGWGNNESGQANPPSGLTNVVAIAAGGFHSLALKSDGSVVAWGRDDFGATEVPPSLTNAIAIAAGTDHSLALRADGSVVAWGEFYGPIPPAATNVVAVACGWKHDLVLKADGTLVAWAVRWDDPWGAAVLPQGLRDVVAIAAGDSDSLALQSDGTIVGWGLNGWGNLNPPAGLRDAVAISAASGHSLALKADGSVVSWGGNPNLPPFVPEPSPPVKAISCGWNHDLILVGWGTPIITVEPWDQHAIEEAGVNLAAKVTGAQPVSYQWRFNGNAIPGATQDHYLINGLRVANAGVYSLLASNALGQIESRAATLRVDAGLPADTNCPPVFPAQEDRTIEEQTGLVVTNAATVCGASPNRLTYDLLEAPPDATIDNAGIIRWIPAEVQGPSTNIFKTLVTDHVVPRVFATNSFVVVVSEVNQPPTLPLQADRTLWTSTVLKVVNSGQDGDFPTNTLTYQLMDPPAGMTIDASGVIRWRPNENQAPSTNLVTTVVTDNGTPPLSATNTFTAVVRAGSGGPQVAVLAGPVINPATGHSYLLLDQASWTNAENAAIALGGHLVTINNTDENTWVYNTFGGYGGIARDLWIGLYDTDPAVNYFSMELEAAKFRWISGEPAHADLWQWGGVSRPTGSGYQSLGHVKIAGPQTPQDWDRAHWLEEYASNEVCSVVELPLNLEIVSPPQRVSGGIGSEATISVFAQGSSPLSYQWQCSGTNLPGQTSSTLIFTNAQPSMSGYYSVVVSDATGSVTSAPVLFSVGGIVPWGTFPHNDPRTVVPSGLSLVKAIAAGWDHDLALKPDGTVVAWGNNDSHQLDVPPDLTNVVAIAGGQGHSLALKSDGSLVAWGSMPQPPATLTQVTSIDAGSDHCLALTSAGTVIGWGGSYGYSGATLGGLTNAVAISAGDFHDLVLKADGSVTDLGPRAFDNPVPADLTNIVAVSAGQTASLALRADGTVVGWETGTSDFFFLALNIPPGLTNVVAISAKANHSMALLADGSVVAWGTNFWGESTVPPRLPNTVAIAGGYNHSLALLRDGAPSVTIQPWDRSVPQGANSSFGAKAVGLQSMNYQWQFNGDDIEGATQSTLTISNAQPADSGTYTLAVSNEVGVTTSRRARLVVASSNPNLPPGLLPLPVNNGTFRVRVNGAIGPGYILQSSGNLKDWLNLQTNSPVSMPFDFVDTSPGSFTNRFYRVRLVP